MIAPSPRSLRGLLLALAIAARLAVPAAADTTAITAVAEVRFLPEGSGAPVVYSQKALRRILEFEIGRPCLPARIEEEVGARYRSLGYVPMVRAECDDGVLRVSLRESSHKIALITFEPSDLGQLGLAAMRVDDEKMLYPVPLNAPRDLLMGLLESRPGDLYNLERDRVDRAALQRLGYVLLFVPGPPAEGDDYRQGAYVIQSVRARSEKTEKRQSKLNYLGGSAGYGPRTGSYAGLNYQRSDIWQGLDSLTISPTFNSSWGGDITYAAPLLAARQGPRRLYDIKLSGFSTFLNNRLLDGVVRDERRTGFSVALGARPLRLQGPNDLRYEAELVREAVDLSGTGGGVTDLSLLRLSATHDWRHTFLPPSMSVRTLPSLELSVPVAGGISFIRPAIQMYAHSRFRSEFETDLHFSAGGLDRPVPDFELFSLGGPTTVRGFQSDTRLGRGIAALQAELWIPFARPLGSRPVKEEEAETPSSAPQVPRFIRMIKGAVFVDGGEVWQAPGIGRESLHGAGLGLRLVVPGQPLVIRLDYAWGFGPEGGHAYPYISLGYAF
jgi:hypothetical protein